MDVEALVQEAAGFFQRGNLAEAQRRLIEALTVNTGHVRALAILGVIHCQQGQTTEGIRLLENAVALEPNYAAAWANLGKSYLNEGRCDDAITACSKAVSLNPQLPLPQVDLGFAYRLKGDFHRALSALRAAISLDPNLIRAYIELGVTLRQMNRLDEAAVAYRQALARNPRIPEAYHNLGNVLADQWRIAEAVASFKTAIELRPDYFEPIMNLGNLYLSQGLVSQAIGEYRKSFLLNRESTASHSNLLFSLNYSPALTDEELFAEHLEWDRLHGRVMRQQLSANIPKTEDKVLRIGYVSADFKKHPVGRFLIPVVTAHNRSRFKIFCYNQAKKDDEFTQRFQRKADVWRDIHKLGDDEVAELVRADQIDILVDLGGHTGDNRLPVFARKPAPIQMTWAGYVGTTGLSALDYLISDRQESPPAAERFCVEKIIRLPDAYICFEPPEDAPPVGPAPLQRNGAVTFGCFNNLAKVTPQAIELWGELMSRTAGSRLILKTMVLKDESVRKRFRDLFRAAGVDPSRVDLQEGASHQVLMDTYNQVDIALDPFPYSGGLTTLEALWMGVPVVTLGGSRFCSRHSITHLAAAGLPELIASSPGQYLDIATGLAGDVERLVALRRGLRGRVARSPLCDGERFTRHLEAAYFQAWQRWCRGEEKQSITISPS